MKTNSEVHLIKNKKISPINNNNKNSSYLNFGNVVSKSKKNKYININCYIKNKEKFNNLIKKNKTIKNTFIKQNYIYNLKNNINELVENHLNNRKNYNIKPKTPLKNGSFRKNYRNNFFDKFFNKEEEKKIDINNNFEFNNNYYTKIDNLNNKYKTPHSRIRRNRSAQNIKSSGLNIFKQNNKIINNSNFNIFTNYYLKNKIQNKYPINNKYINEYTNRMNIIPNEKYINLKKSIFSKDKNTQVNIIEDNSKNSKNENYISSIKPNEMFTKRKNNYYIKKNILKKDNNNNIKSENSNKTDKTKDKIKVIKLINDPSKNKLNNEKSNSKNISKPSILSTRNLSLSKKIKFKGMARTIDNIVDSNNGIQIIEKNLINIKEEEKQSKINKINNKLILDLNEKERIKSFDVITQAGRDKNFFRKINQDNYIISTNINKMKNFNIFGVLDGHGLYGHLISIFVGKFIINSFTHIEELKSCSNYEEIYLMLKRDKFKIINDIFVNAEKELYKEEFDSNFSGTTCIIVIEVGEHIICANSGDSRAILVYTDFEKFDNYIKQSIKKESQKEIIENNIINSHYQIKNIIRPFSNNKRNSSFTMEKIKKKKIFKKNKKIWKILTKIFCLSYDLKPTLPLEKKRIYNKGGRVEKFKENDGSMNGPPRVWVKNEMYPGLAMSRSIGDFIATSVGVIPDPEIIEYTLDQNSRYMVIATDGIWEFLSNEKVMKIGNRFYPKFEPIDLCNELVKEANKCWEKEEFIRDDITVLVAYF